MLSTLKNLQISPSFEKGTEKGTFPELPVKIFLTENHPQLLKK
jgi:hypothetical protein